MSTIKAINLVHPSGSTGIAMDTSGNATVAGSMVASSSYAWRNRIINGDMRIDQRNAGASVTIPGASSTYSLDRWNCFEDTDGSVSIQQIADAPSGFVNSARVTVATADSSLGATQRAIFYQPIEGLNVSDLGFGTASARSVTLSFWVKSSVAGQFGGAFTNGNNRSYPYSYTISAANTWEQKTVTLTGDTTGTWATNNTTGIVVVFSLGAGSSYSGTAGAWTAGDINSTTGSTNLLATLSATWQVTGVQLEVGTVATPFERRDYGRELIMCQRYYIRTPDAERALKRNYNWSGSLIAINVSADFPVTMRGSPTMSVFGDISDGSQISLGGAGVASTVYTFSAYTNVSNGQFLDFHYYIASAEL